MQRLECMQVKNKDVNDHYEVSIRTPAIPARWKQFDEVPQFSSNLRIFLVLYISDSFIACWYDQILRPDCVISDS